MQKPEAAPRPTPSAHPEPGPATPNTALGTRDPEPGAQDPGLGTRDSGLGTPGLLAVDAGGTRTRALWIDLNGESCAAEAPGANWTVHGPELSRRRIEAAVDATGGDHFGAFALCLAGYYPPDHQAAVEAWLQGWLGSRCAGAARMVVPDVVGAWAGALDLQPGLVLISGTGSICYGRSRSGAEARAGGWGPLLGDPGSGYAVGVDAVRAMADELDGLGPATQLSQLLPGVFPDPGANPRSWIRGLYRLGWTREQVASLAPSVVQASESGDAAAAAILARAAESLADLAGAVARRLGPEVGPLVLQGGLARGWPGMSAAIDQVLARRGVSLPLRQPRFNPLGGAALLAAEALPGEARALPRVRRLLQHHSPLSDRVSP
jgi:glucosamine kinase